ncbi:OLC1v1005569C6 [Oldenlandia corymbosa var. corymbosa]|uniref:OLC1v1005569C6 n=1 Tax=Oldenlandia corymbosa var. corymbosa TaxID=529605 RepID=A0AAV1DGX6_OLDCO|nr:OLC1v1005569C6 [Oldenlandia corymbosa var. corymbosa]
MAQNEDVESFKMKPLQIFFNDARSVFRMDEIGKEIFKIALPAALALTADPIASLIDTAFIGRIGPVEIAAVGVSIALFNQVSRIAIFPLVSVTTSFVAEEDTKSKITPNQDDESLVTVSTENRESKDAITSENNKNDSFLDANKFRSPENGLEMEKSKTEKRHIPSASSALLIGGILGILQAEFLILAAKPLLNFMGVKSDSPIFKPAEQYLKLRSVGAPAVLLSLALQGVFRGFKDTKTPLYATVIGDIMNISLDPIFMFVFKWGVKGAAIAHVLSQYLIVVILFWRLVQQLDLLPPSFKHLQLNRFLNNGFLLLIRVIAVTFCVTLAASFAARKGPTSMAAFQVCLQVWMATSLLADGLAVAGQAQLASAFTQEDYNRAAAITSRVLQLGVALGLVLAIILGVGLKLGAKLFTSDPHVIQLIGVGIPVSLLQGNSIITCMI